MSGYKAKESVATDQCLVDALSLKKVLSRLNRHAFEEFAYRLCAFDEDRFMQPAWLPEAGEGVFQAGFIDSYGGSVHNVWVLQFLPQELFSNLGKFCCEDPVLFERLKNVGRLYKGKKGAIGMVDPYLETVRQLQNVSIITNIHGYDRTAYIDKFFPIYKRVLHKSGLRVSFQLGSYDSFVDLREVSTRHTFLSFLAQQADGLSISLHPESQSATLFSVESPIRLGLENRIKTPCEPVYTKSRQIPALAEFEALLKPNVTEARIERFLKQHFQEIFGFEYDRIETQLWLRFPKFDVNGKNRRLDVFMRNTIHKDWELFELKRVVPVTGSHRDIPVLAAEVSRSIQQTLYYSKLLAKDSVKQCLAKEGIEYFEPTLNLVIGRKPQISHDQWRWLAKNATGDVRLLTYDNLLDSMRVRVEERENVARMARRK